MEIYPGGLRSQIRRKNKSEYLLEVYKPEIDSLFQDSSSYYVGFFLLCDVEVGNTDWSCYVDADLRFDKGDMVEILNEENI